MNYRKVWKNAYNLYASGCSSLELFNKINSIMADICYKNSIPKDVVRGGFSLDDLLQECSIKLYELTDKLTQDRDNKIEPDITKIHFEAYISSIIKHRFIDACRKMKAVEDLDSKFRSEKRIEYISIQESFEEDPFEALYETLRLDCESKVVSGGIILDTLFNTGAHGITARLAAIGITDTNEKYMYERIRKVKKLVKECAYGKKFSDKIESKRFKDKSS